MTVERIDSRTGLERVREAYERVYAADPHRMVFVSWSWLYSFAIAMRRHWSLLAVRERGEYVGFLFLVADGASLGPFAVYRELGLGAYPSADYTGLIVARSPDAVLEALANFIKHMRWDVLRARSIRDSRISQLVAMLARGNVVRREESTACHVVPLPQSWNAFVGESAEKPARRYAIRRIGAWKSAAFTISADDTIDRDIETLLTLHRLRWKSNLRKARRTYGRLFKEAYHRGCCLVGVLWSERGKPLAAQAAFVDPERTSWGIYMVAYDRSYPKHSPGIGMLVRGLQHAISERFAEYDFLRGNEGYKARFGSEIRWLENFTISRPSRRARASERIWSAAVNVKRTLRSIIVGGIRASV